MINQMIDMEKKKEMIEKELFGIKLDYLFGFIDYKEKIGFIDYKEKIQRIKEVMGK